MKKMFVAVTFIVVAICALTVFTFTFNTDSTVEIIGEPANAIATSSADKYTYDRHNSPVGLNEENQYDIIADNHLYGHDDYGDYVPAETRYVDGFPTVDGKKVYSKYYENKGYVKPAEEEKPREEWNLHDFHANGEYFETIGNGEMHFYNEEDMEAYVEQLRDEFGAENVHEIKIDAEGTVDNSNTSNNNGSSLVDNAQDTVNDVNQSQEDTLNSVDNG